jgi:hypothetical protein
MGKKKIIYIAGEGHSGSTLLDLLLSTHPQVCGLGEVQMLVSDEKRSVYTKNAESIICSCGEPISRCELWGNFIKYVDSIEGAKFEERYIHLLKIADNKMGDDVIISDSSKYVNPLQKVIGTIQKTEDYTLDDLFVVHLIKDARAWATSIKYRYNIGLLKTSRYMLEWLRNNKNIYNILETNRIDYMRVRYEDICFDTKKTVEKILNDAGIPCEDGVGELDQAKAHVGLGNSMRTDKDKSRRIIYDSRWFYEPGVNILYYTIPGVRSYNEGINSLIDVH